MLAVRKQIIEPATNPRIATAVITCRRSGAIELSDAIIMPNELGLANPQIAYVAIAELRSCKKKTIYISVTSLISPSLIGVNRK